MQTTKADREFIWCTLLVYIMCITTTESMLQLVNC